jgi:ribosomal protein S18 acetylase RimI-like enzyme
MPVIRYTAGNEELLERIEPLWEELNALHRDRSVYFQDFYAGNTFQARKKALLASASKGALLVVLASEFDSVIGYCVASAADGAGEVDSLFVCEAYRKMGVASNLMERALAWLNGRGVRKAILKVSAGNEGVFGFYAKHGFYPRLTELQMIPDSIGTKGG